MRRLFFAAAVSTASIAGMAAAWAKPAAPKFLPPVRYVCEDGTRLSVVFSRPDVSPGTAVLRILGTGTELTLDRLVSADGGRYGNATTEFWDKGATATYTAGGKTLPCRKKR